MKYKIGIIVLIVSLLFNIFLLFQNKELEKMADSRANIIYSNWYRTVMALSDPDFYSSLSENEESREIGRFFGASEDLVGILLTKYPKMDRNLISSYTMSSIFSGEINPYTRLKMLMEKHNFSEENLPTQEQFEALFKDVDKELN
ncbi:hypothetical protein ACTNEO_09830 [Gracilibacillus sp. HCP3S3_G5_1]|uniref:hypothetical protein n=1 Tax=unclassified Gracilibacillus TaxID=2625209 RepID=UPI003F8AC82A